MPRLFAFLLVVNCVGLEGVEVLPTAALIP